MKQNRITRNLVVTSALLLGIACSEAPTGPERGSPEGPAPEPTGPVTVTISPTGGVATATTDDSVRVTLSFPEGAVRGPVDVSLRPSTPESGAWLSMDLEPAGMIFFDEVSIDVELPSSVDPTDAGLWLGPGPDGVLLPVASADRTISGSLRFFGLTESTRLRATGNPAQGVGAAPVGLLGNATRSSHSGGTGPNNLGGGAVNCADVVADLRNAFDALVASGTEAGLMQAVEVALRIAWVLRTSATCPGADAWVQAAKDVVCQELGSAIARAGGLPTQSGPDFEEQAGSIVTWSAKAQVIAPECAALEGVANAIDREGIEFGFWHEQLLSGLAVEDFGTYQDLKEAVLDALDVVGIAAALGAFDISDRVEAVAVKPPVARMRDVAYAICRSKGWHYPLSRLTATGFFALRDIVGVPSPREGATPPDAIGDFTDTDIFRDLQTCGTNLSLVARTVGAKDFTTVRSGGEGPDSSATTSVPTPTRGKLVVTGHAYPFTCWGDIAADPHVIVTFDDVPVDTILRPDSAYLADDSLVFEVGDLASKAGITPVEGGEAPLTFLRERTQCDERLWGPETDTVAHFQLKWVPPTLATKVVLPAEIEAGDTVDVNVNVRVIDQLGDTAVFDAIDLELTSSGGTLLRQSGLTDATGSFRTRLIVGGPSPTSGDVPSGVSGGPGSEVTPMNQAASQSVSVTAVATSFEGASATGTGTAQVLRPLPKLTSAHRVLTHHVTAYDDQGCISGAGHTGYQSSDANYSNTVTDSATCPSGSESTVTVSMDAMTNFAGNGVKSFSMTGSAEGQLTGTGVAQGSLSATWRFEVPQEGAAYRIQATLEDTESTSVNLILGQTGSSDRIHYVDTAGPVDLSGTLAPGEYWFNIASAVSPGVIALSGAIVFNP